jgi:uncharacterized membrane protein
MLRQGLAQSLRQLPGRLQKLPTQGAVERLQAAAKSARGVSWRMVGAAALLGGIIHICATFVAPFVTAGHAYLTLAEKLPVNRMVVLPLQAPGRQLLPYLPADMLYAVCRFDLSGGAVAVKAPVLDAGWALSLHTPHGSNFYVLPGLPQRRTDVSFLVVPTGDAQPIPRRESAADTQIASPTPEGLIMLRAPLRGLAWAAEVEAVLQRASCTPVKR